MSTLERALLPDDVHDIQMVSIGGGGRDDYPAWSHTKNGLFTAGSAYHLTMDIRKHKSGALESSSSVSKHKGWLELWDTSVPAKAKIHTWRLARNGLALTQNFIDKT